MECFKFLEIEVPGGSDGPTPPHLGFLIRPIQELFSSQRSGLAVLLKKLNVLAVRFRRKYFFQPRVDWRNRFDIETPYLDDMFTASSHETVVRRMTLHDEYLFKQISVQSFRTKDATLRSLLNKWNDLVAIVEESCLAHPGLYCFFRDTAKVGYRAVRIDLSLD